MANRKFYYRNRNKSSSANVMEERSKTLENYSEAQLSLTLEALGISDASRKLLADNGIATAAALVVRSEKDMYKVQGLNKRVLFEVREALKKNGMELYREPEKEAQAPAQAQPKQDKKQAPEQKKKDDKPSQGKTRSAANQGQKSDAKADKKGEGQRGSKFGLADRREDRSPRGEKQERITEPLPVELWRKILKGGKWGFTDGFKTVIPPMYDEVFSFKEGLASVEIDGKCGFIDSENNVVVPLEYDLAMSFSQGLAMVARGEKCGYINKDNEVVIDFAYDAATPFEDGEAKVKKDGKWATLTPDGKLTWI